MLLHLANTTNCHYYFKLKRSVLTDKISVKISGDGAKFSKSSQFVLLSFSLPFLSSSSLSGYGKLSIIAVYRISLTILQVTTPSLL